jgi:hypothetical protein
MEDPIVRLTEAVNRRAPVVVTVPLKPKTRHCCTQFLAMEFQMVWVATVASEEAALAEAYKEHYPVLVSFKADRFRASFVSQILAWEPRYQIQKPEGVETFEALALSSPKEIKIDQRRKHPRIELAGMDASVTIWRLETMRQVDPEKFRVDARDLSLGGIGLLLIQKDAKSRTVAIGDHVQVEIRWGGVIAVLPGQIRSAHAQSPGGLRLGIQWTTVEKSLQGRQQAAQLSAIVEGLEQAQAATSGVGLWGGGG